ncbi:helix-turn-helix domain-containing protein [Streptomyces sp. CA-210063]|uniref:helix-turn-helix domain-containing protein n=1 Tax=Streptomyces sp. CA-210063 TaxID=2801029 RepID=UPI00214AB6F5|nr:helix-turn-helix domain-containing protein [Streptomyces sp. CA-210063]UUU31734.1 helix-turn-helix domain-containing protein [Streptomyces sp. CA-210063]
MAETKPSGATRPHSRVPRSATRSGVTHVREFQPDRFTIIGNHLAQHPELSLTAIGLGTHILSLPQGASADIRTLAERFPEGRDRIAFALRELEAHGYVERVRERVDGGRVVTRTYVYNAPALTRAREEAADGRVPVAADAPAVPAVSVEPAAPVVPVPAVVEDASGLGEPVAPTPPPAETEPPASEHHDKAVAFLVGLRRSDDRFTLSQRDVRRLTPAVVAWFDNGASRTAVHHAMTADVPALLKSPARFLAYRLRELLPPPPPLALPPEGLGVPEAPPSDTWPLPMVDCEGGCNRAFRAPEPGAWCRDCRAARDRRTAEAAGPESPETVRVA